MRRNAVWCSDTFPQQCTMCQPPQKRYIKEYFPFVFIFRGDNCFKRIWHEIFSAFQGNNNNWDTFAEQSCFEGQGLIQSCRIGKSKSRDSLKIGKNSDEIGNNRFDLNSIDSMRLNRFDFLLDFLARMPKYHKMPKCLHFRSGSCIKIFF